MSLLSRLLVAFVMEMVMLGQVRADHHHEYREHERWERDRERAMEARRREALREHERWAHFRRDEERRRERFWQQQERRRENWRERY